MARRERMRTRAARTRPFRPPPATRRRARARARAARARVARARVARARAARARHRPRPPAPAARREAELELQRLQVLAKGADQVRALERKLHGGLQEAELVAGVVPDPLEAIAVELAPLPQGAQAVGELDLASLVAGSALQAVEDVGGEDVTPDDREVARRRLRPRLLDQVADPVDAAVAGLRRPV